MPSGCHSIKIMATITAFTPDPEFVFPYPFTRTEESVKNQLDSKMALKLLSGSGGKLATHKGLFRAWLWLIAATQPQHREWTEFIWGKELEIELTSTNLTPKIHIKLIPEMFGSAFSKDLASLTPLPPTLAELETLYDTVLKKEENLLQNELVEAYFTKYEEHLTALDLSGGSVTALKKQLAHAKEEYDGTSVYAIELKTKAGTLPKGTQVALVHTKPETLFETGYNPGAVPNDLAVTEMHEYSLSKANYTLLDNIPLPPIQTTTMESWITSLQEWPLREAASQYPALLEGLTKLAAVEPTENATTFLSLFNKFARQDLTTANSFVLMFPTTTGTKVPLVLHLDLSYQSNPWGQQKSYISCAIYLFSFIPMQNMNRDYTFVQSGMSKVIAGIKSTMFLLDPKQVPNSGWTHTSHFAPLLTTNNSTTTSVNLQTLEELIKEIKPYTISPLASAAELIAKVTK